MLSPSDGVGGGPLVVAVCSCSCFWLGNMVSHDTHDGTHVQTCCCCKVLGKHHTGPSKAHEPRPVRGHAVRRGLWDAMCSQRLRAERGCRLR